MDENLASRELWNGELFVLGIVMGATFLSFIFNKWQTADRYDAASVLAAALCCFTIGIGVRGGYVSVLLHCQNIVADCRTIEDNAWVMHLAGVTFVVGGLWALGALSPPNWRPWSWVCPAIIVIMLPVIYYTARRWNPLQLEDGALVHGSHEWKLVVLSVIVAIATSYTALDLAGRVRATSGKASILWVIAAAVAMGGGIWSMHFVAMLSFTLLGIPVYYDLQLTALSLFLPIAVCMAGFFIVAVDRTSTPLLWLSGILIGCGVVAMHYVGMAAMRMEAFLTFDRLLVVASILVAIGASVVAVWIAFGSGVRSISIMLAAAIVEGFAIAGMHYTAMAAAIFYSHPLVSPAFPATVIVPGQLATSVAAITFAILLAALAAALFDRRRHV